MKKKHLKRLLANANEDIRVQKGMICELETQVIGYKATVKGWNEDSRSVVVAMQSLPYMEQVRFARQIMRNRSSPRLMHDIAMSLGNSGPELRRMNVALKLCEIHDQKKQTFYTQA